MPKSGIAGSYGISVFNFLRSLHKVLLNGCISLHSHQQFIKVAFSPHPLQQLYYRHFNHVQSDQCEMIPQCGFRLHFSYNQWCWATFLCLLVICISSLFFWVVFVAEYWDAWAACIFWRLNFFVSFSVVINFSQFQRLQFSSVQSLSRVRLFATPWITAHQASLSITNSRSSLRLMSIESVMPSSHLILCCPLLLLPPIPPIIRIFSNEPTLHMRWQSPGVSALASVLPKKF